MPIIGIMASSMRADMNSYESIQSVTVGSGGATSIDFTSIPSTYKHLQLRGIYRQNGVVDWMAMTVNGSALGFRHLFWGTGGPGIGAYGDSATQFIRLGTGFACFILDIYDYANTNKHKTLKVSSGFSYDSGNGSVGITSNRFASNNAITSLSFINNNGNYSQYSSIALYGLKGE